MELVYDVRGLVLILVMCHLIGDYVLQNDFIAKTKGENLYHLFIHCALYCLPFMVIFSGWQLFILFISHCIVDMMKATYNKIDYKTDQLLHYVILWLLGFFVL